MTAFYYINLGVFNIIDTFFGLTNSKNDFFRFFGLNENKKICFCNLMTFLLCSW